MALACLVCLVCNAVLSMSARADQQQDAFNAGKAVGQQAATATTTRIQNGSAVNSTVATTVPGYTATPAQSQLYGSKNLTGAAAQQQAQCAQTTNAPTCSAVTVAATPRPNTANLSPASSALASQAVVANPTLVLGAVASTYNACSVGGAQTSAAQYQASSCTLQANPWTDYSCVKSLGVKPSTTTSCTDGALIADTVISGGGGWMEIKAYCDPLTASKVRFTAHAWGLHGACSDPLVTSVDLANPVGAQPGWPAILGNVMPNWGGACNPLVAVLVGPGCSNGSCSVGAHFVDAPGVQPHRVCAGAGETLGSQITFAQWNNAPDNVLTACYKPFADADAAGGLPGAIGTAGDVTAYWAQTSQSNTSGWEWAAGQHFSTNVSFVEPRLFPETGDSWSNGCASYEARTAVLRPDASTTPTDIATVLPGLPDVSQCVRTASTCTNGPSTKIIDGVSVTRECWSYAQTFACSSLAGSSTCPDPAVQTCTPTGPPQCQQSDAAGHCVLATMQYQCKASEASFTPALNCGNSTFCANGSCWDTTTSPNTGFANAATQIEAHVAAAKDIDSSDPHNIKIFKGMSRNCVVGNFGLDNCCNDEAFLQHCSAADQQLHLVRDQGQCHEVGEYCSASSWLFGCRERTHTFCCFGSLLARLVQEQGRAQIGRDWGTPQSASCSGFTPTELAALDWSQFDLSEFFAQLNIGTPPAQGAVATGVQSQQSSCYYNDGRC